VAAVALVSGLVPYDSGKTWFTLGAALAARERGLRVSVFKPVAAHNLWYSPLTVRRSLELGALVGNDVLRYAEWGLVGDVRLSNPVAIATVPPDPGRYPSIEGYMEDFGDVSRIAVLSRVYECKSGRQAHYVHAENLSRAGERARRLVERMGKALAAEPRSFADLAGYLGSPRAAENLNECLERLRADSDVVFVESFSDAITPYGGLLEAVDLVVIVAPGVAYVYRDVGSLRRAAQEAVERLGPAGYRSLHVFRSARPDLSIETGFASRPSPRRPHREFVEKGLAPVLSGGR